MSHAILVPLDGSALSEAALRVAGRLAAASGASVHLLAVHRWMQAWEPVPEIRETIEEMDGVLREQKAAYVRARAVELGRRVERPIRAEVRDGFPASGIAEYARQQRCGLIVLASHGHGGPNRRFLGSVTHRLLREAPSPVLVLPADSDGGRTAPAPPFGHALVALDGSASAVGAFAAVLELADALGVRRLTLFTSVGRAPAFDAIVGAVTGRARSVSADEHLRCAERYLVRVARGAAIAGAVELACAARIADDPITAILEHAAAASADLVVLGIRGLGGAVRTVRSSVADEVVRTSRVAALVVGWRSAAPPLAHELDELSTSAEAVTERTSPGGALPARSAVPAPDLSADRWEGQQPAATVERGRRALPEGGAGLIQS